MSGNAFFTHGRTPFIGPDPIDDPIDMEENRLPDLTTSTVSAPPIHF